MIKENIFDPVLDSIANDDIREFAEHLIIHDCPDYFYEIGASSTGRYHPSYALGELGLARHTCALVRFLIWIIDLEYIKEQMDSRDRDLLIVAGLTHDWLKCGDKDNVQKYTVFNHPILAANMIRKYKGVFLSEAEIDFVAECVQAHMGEFNKDKKSSDELPKPNTTYEYFIHLADYLASRKQIEMQFDDWEKPALPPLDTYELDFGRHKGKRLVDVASSDKGYKVWLKENYGREPVRSLLKLL